MLAVMDYKTESELNFIQKRMTGKVHFNFFVSMVYRAVAAIEDTQVL